MRTPRSTRLRTGVDPTPSQLDIIAEVNERAAREHRGRRLRRLAVAGAAVLLVAGLWWSMQGGATRAPAPRLPAAAVPAEPLRNEPAPVAQDKPAASAGALPASAPVEATAVPLAETDAAAEERARKARARREAEARVLALQVQQERSQVQAQERQQREAEREAQQARELADAAPGRSAEPAPAPAQPAAEPRRGVRERCAASGNIFSELVCQSRECRRPEHANEALCIRLREIEESQRSGSR